MPLLMNRGPLIIEHGRSPPPRDGTPRRLAPLAEHLRRSIPSAVLVTLHSRRPADDEDELLVWGIFQLTQVPIPCKLVNSVG